MSQPTQPYTFAIRTSQCLTKNCKRVCLANALTDRKDAAKIKDEISEDKNTRR